MSLSQAKAAETRDRSEAAPALRPFWLRSAALVVIVGLHSLLFLAARTPSSLLMPLDAVEVALEPLGDAPEDQQAVAEISPSEPPPTSAPAAPPPEQERTEPTAPPPQVVVPDAVPLPVAELPALNPNPVVKPKPAIRPRPRPTVDEAEEDEDDERPTPAELRAQRRRAQEASERRGQAQEGRRAARRGVADGAAAVGGMSHASYAALLAAEIRRRSFYPAAARASGASGSVGVAFTVGPSGRLAGLSITRSSGDATLDDAARSILRAIHTPPPPGGHFSASTSIRFHLN